MSKFKPMVYEKAKEARPKRCTKCGTINNALDETTLCARCGHTQFSRDMKAAPSTIKNIDEAHNSDFVNAVVQFVVENEDEVNRLCGPPRRIDRKP